MSARMPNRRVTASGVTRGPDPEKNDLDERQYRNITLANELKVLLVTDAKANEAGVALSVRVGSFDEPDELPGLAHLLEHAVFLGNQKYPDTGSFENFVQARAGYSNAGTSDDLTTYYYCLPVQANKAQGDKAATGSTAPEHGCAEPSQPRGLQGATRDSMHDFEESLDQFAHMFISPLFREDAVTSETNVLNSEHSDNLEDDDVREIQILKLFCNPKHPFHRFDWGNCETLIEKPRQQGIRTCEELVRFYNNYYSSNLMQLCVVSPYDLDHVQDLVVRLFSGIQNRKIAPPSLAHQNTPLRLASATSQMVRILPRRDVRKIEIIWALPSRLASYRTSPFSLISWLLERESENSLEKLFKEKSWADTVCTSTFCDTMACTLFSISIFLSKGGIENLGEIVGCVFSYIKHLRQKGIPKHVVEEWRGLRERSFRFKSQEEPGDYADSLARRLAWYEPQEVLKAPYRANEPSKDEVCRFLDSLAPEKAIIETSGHFNKEVVSEVEQYNGGEFHVEPISKKTLETWTRLGSRHKLQPPGPSPWIPKSLEMLEEPGRTKETDAAFPSLVLETGALKLYHKLDTSFNVPKAVARVRLFNPITTHQVEETLKTNLFVLMFGDSVSAWTDVAAVGGIYYSFYSRRSLELRVSGFSDKLEELLLELVDRLVEFTPSDEQYKRALEEIDYRYQDFVMAGPLVHASSEAHDMTHKSLFDIVEANKILQSGRITLETVRNFCKQTIATANVQALFTGNIGKDAALATARQVCDKLKICDGERERASPFRVAELPTGVDVVSMITAPNPNEQNSAAIVRYQCGESADYRFALAIAVLVSIIDPIFFKSLRTEQELGYRVSCRNTYAGNVDFVDFSVQSETEAPDELCRKIDEFIEEIPSKVLDCLKPEDWESAKQAHMAILTEPDLSLESRSNRFWNELSRDYPILDRTERNISALESLTQEYAVEVFDQCFRLDGSSRRRLVSMVYGSKHQMPDASELSRIDNALGRGKPLRFVQDPHAFRAARPQFPAESIAELGLADV